MTTNRPTIVQRRRTALLFLADHPELHDGCRIEFDIDGNAYINRNDEDAPADAIRDKYAPFPLTDHGHGVYTQWKQDEQ